jgi:hypothetical protein
MISYPNLISVFSPPGFKHSISLKRKKNEGNLLTHVKFKQKPCLNETCIKGIKKKSMVTSSNDTCHTSSSLDEKKNQN